MKLSSTVAAAAALILAAGSAAAHPCDDDAKRRAAVLLSLHFADDVVADMQTENQGIGDEVTELAPVKSLKGKGKFDVLEVWGYIYKGEYRMRFIYAQIPDSCVLMGQEILESADPY